jgi:DNA polymerase I-like protein with 3'-5' exonuclease and polymerase domains
VFIVMHPAAGERNRLLYRIFDRDFTRALKAEHPPMPPIDAKFYQIETLEDSLEAVQMIREEAPVFSYDTETGGVMHSRYFEVVTVSICPSGTDIAYVWERDVLSNSTIRQPLLDLLEDPSIGKAGHNIKYDNHAIRCAFGTIVQGTEIDTRLQLKLLESDIDASLDVAVERVGMGGMKAEAKVELQKAKLTVVTARKEKKDKQGAFDFDEDPIIAAACDYPKEAPERFTYALMKPPIRARYCARDSIGTSRLADSLEQRLPRFPGVQRVWDQIVSKATDAIGQIEYWGIAADREGIRAIDTVVTFDIQEVDERIRSHGDYNPSSPHDIERLLYDDIGLKAPDTTETGRRSTAKDTLFSLKGKHPVVEDILAYRKLETYRDRYGLSMLNLIRDDGRFHPELKIDGARTGRLSCVSPALHQAPRAETELGKMVRGAFRAARGCVLGQLDYSQLELRIAAMLSGDPVMIQMFLSGEDFHTATAKEIAKEFWGIEPEDVRKEHRTYAKQFNFGLIYGMSDTGVAKKIGCTTERAAALRKAVLGKWVVLDKWLKECLNHSRKTGYTGTWWDGEDARIRQLFDIHSQDSKRRSRAENGAANTKVQGTASDYMLLSLAMIVEWILKENLPAKLVLSVHDSAILEIEKGAEDEVMNGAAEIMQSHNSLGVPLKVDGEIGESWGGLEAFPVAA